MVVDLYAGDGRGPDDLRKLALAGAPWHGISLKATEGTYYPDNKPSDREWFLDNWIRCRIYAGARYGVDWFRGFYHYFRVDQSGLLQAEKCLTLVEIAGGLGSGDLWPMIDVESAENPTDASAQMIEDGVSEFAAKILAETGRMPMLYGNVYLAEHGVTRHMGCGTLNVARYTADLLVRDKDGHVTGNVYERIGWKLQNPAAMPTLWGWQLCGDGEVYVPGYPKVTPLGPADYTAIIAAGGGQAGIDWTAANLFSTPALS